MNENFKYNDDEELIEGFWQTYKNDFPKDYRKWKQGTSQNGLSTDCRCIWVDWVDHVVKSGEVDEEVADEVTL